MDIEKLKALKVIVETGSITRAAERLGYSQPGLTGMLNRLEQEIGYPVLQRGSGGVSLTESGEALMPHVERILRDNRALEQAIADHRPEERRILRIGSYTSISRNWLPQVLKGFGTEFPDVELTVKDGSCMDIEQWLMEGTIDVGLLSNCFSAPLEFLPLLQDRYYAVLPPEEKPRETFDISAFNGRTFFVPSNGVDTEVLRILERSGVTPRFSLIATEDSAVIKMVEQGLGCSLLSELILRGSTDHVSLVPIDPPAFREVGAAVRSLKKAGPVLRSFLRYIRRDAEK